MIGHARSDERGKYSGGKAGDQTGNEVSITPWYSRPWNWVFWSTDPDTRERMAVSMEQACNNPNIGYDQGGSGNTQDRYSLYELLRKNGFDMSKVDKPCETDCSQLVADVANCAGISISPYVYTGNIRSAFKQAGGFEFHNEKKYLESDQYVPRGAVWLYEGHHTAINLNNGSRWAKDGWIQSGEEWNYYKSGKKLVREWLLFNEHWYRLGTRGEMLTGMHQIYDSDGKLRNCYFGEDGVLWHESDDRQGYLEPWTVEKTVL